jgi:hypothetical protein
MKNFFLLVPIIYLFLCYSCSETKTVNHPVLHVALTQSEVPFSEFFNNIEIIPLETHEESLIKKIGKAMYINGQYYLLDINQFYLFIFDSTGRYVNHIAKVGQGPGEYTYIYDFLVNTKKDRIEMLSPYRQIFYYDYNGNFIEDIRFSDEIPFIYRMRYADDYLVLYSISIINEGQTIVNVVSPKTGERVNGYWNDDYYTPSFTSFSYGNDAFFNHALNNKVYKIEPDSFTIAYEWEYDKEIIDSVKYRKVIDGIPSGEALYKKIDTGEIPYFYLMQTQTDRYYYAQLFYKYKTIQHVFYDKQTEKSYYFEHLEEGVTFKPWSTFVNDNYMLTMLEYADRESYLQSSLLDEENRKKLLNMTEYDNPVLVKYTFKE